MLLLFSGARKLGEYGEVVCALAGAGGLGGASAQ